MNNITMKSLIFILLLCLSHIPESAAQLPPPPPPTPQEQEISITDSVEPIDDEIIDFGQVETGMFSDQVITIWNLGPQDLNLFHIAVRDPLSPPFSIATNNCPGILSSQVRSCTLTVRFEPTSADVFSDSFDIESNDTDENPKSIFVSGTGNNPPSTPQLIYPGNEATGISLSSDFTWEKATDLDGDPISYSLSICRDPDLTSFCISQTNIAVVNKEKVYYAGFSAGFMFIGFLFTGNLRDRKKILCLIILLITCTVIIPSCGGGGDGSGTSIGGTTITRTVSGLEPGTIYFWQVTANDGRGGLSQSEIRSFVTQ
ncbi:MAG: choice-of-anchor D domain-containing protein [Nitrospiraceae bacterium]|nr:MAG: choice-of-anchor D domain-containing protein [Nitrospiraceae bacterium]